MKVLLATDIFPPVSGGPATYSVTLAREFTAQSITVTIVSLTVGADASQVPCPVIAVKPGPKVLRYLAYFWYLWRAARAADVIYAMGPVNAGLPAWVVSRLRRRPLAVKVVGDYAWEQGTQRFGVAEDVDAFQSAPRQSFPVKILRAIESFVVSHADRVITPSQYLRRMVVGWGAPEEKVKVVYNAVGFKEAVPVSKPPGEFWIVSVGRLVPWKGMATLIRVAGNLRSEYPGLRLKILGDGPELKALQKSVQELGLAGIADLRGNVARDQTLGFIAAADLFILNSGYEGLSHTLLEVAHAGRPILASNKGGNPEVVIPGQTGELFPFEDGAAIEKITREVIAGVRQLSRALSGPEREAFFTKFSLPTMVAETRLLLERLCRH